jgi:hypothetical protein
MNVVQGNTDDLAKDHAGWLIGHFMGDSPFRTEHVEVKWIRRKKGIVKKGLQTTHDGHTILILIGGRMAIRFPFIGQAYFLLREGDFISFNAKEDSHETETFEDSTAFVIKWPSVPK